MKRKIQLIETIDASGPYFKVTDGTDSKYVCFGTNKTRAEALEVAKAIFRFWNENGKEKVIMELELQQM